MSETPQTPKPESQQFDKLLQENIKEIFLPFVIKRMGIEVDKIEPLKIKLHRTHAREADWLFMVSDTEGNVYILHVEFQSHNDRNMVYRIGEYHGMIQRQYKLPIRHFVVFLGDEPMNMQQQLPGKQVYHGFESINLYDIPWQKLIDSEVPAEIILAILGDFQGTTPQEVIKQIYQKLRKSSLVEDELKKYLQQLNILSGLRKLNKVITETIVNMPISINLDEFYSFQMGLKKGRAELQHKLEAEQKRLRAEKDEAIKAEQKKLEAEQKKLEAEQKRLKTIVFNCLNQGMSIAATAKLVGLNPEEVKAIQDKSQ